MGYDKARVQLAARGILDVETKVAACAPESDDRMTSIILQDLETIAEFVSIFF